MFQLLVNWTLTINIEPIWYLSLLPSNHLPVFPSCRCINLRINNRQLCNDCRGEIVFAILLWWIECDKFLQKSTKIRKAVNKRSKLWYQIIVFMTYFIIPIKLERPFNRRLGDIVENTIWLFCDAFFSLCTSFSKIRMFCWKLIMQSELVGLWVNLYLSLATCNSWCFWVNLRLSCVFSHRYIWLMLYLSSVFANLSQS